MHNRTVQVSQVLVWRYFSQRILTLEAWSLTFRSYGMGPRRGSSEAGHRGCARERTDIVPYMALISSREQLLQKHELHS